MLNLIENNSIEVTELHSGIAVDTHSPLSVKFTLHTRHRYNYYHIGF